MKIFLSYGHDNFAALAERLKNDLSKMGYPTWFDKDALRCSVIWQDKIENAILESEWLILLMTSHSVRRPDGVCLDEVSLARNHKKQILPIMLQKVTPPLSIVRLQYMDLENLCCTEGQVNEELYQKTLNDIIEIFKGMTKLSCEGGQQTLVACLQPLDNDVYFSTFKSNFTGREWLFDKYDLWLKNDSSKLFILLGGPGTGKSAIAANLCVKKAEISGIHFCKYNNCDRADPKRVIMSLAYHLATQVPEYAEALVLLNDLKSLKEKNVQRLFEYIFTEPLAKIEWKKDPIVLIIDALDEADSEGKNALLDVVANCFHKTPKWLKLLVTARPEAEIVRKFKKFVPTVVESNEENSDDIKEHFRLSLKIVKIDFTEKQIEKLCTRCQGSFLYATEILKEIVAGRMCLKNIDKFPEGMMAKYEEDFTRLFPDVSVYKERIAPLLEILVARQTPLTIDEAAEILSKDPFDLDEIYDEICTFFPKQGDLIVPLHKSVYDWLIDRSMAGKHAVSAVRGHKTLCTFYNMFFDNGTLSNDYAVKYLVRHNIFAGNFSIAHYVLINMEWQDKRNKIYALDSFLRLYLSEVEEIYKKNKELAHEILSSEYFISIFTTHRKPFFYGPFFYMLATCGFDEVAKKLCNENPVDVEKLAVLLPYYYANEKYDQVSEIIMSIGIFQELNKLTDLCDESEKTYYSILKAELHNVTGWSYWKCGDFENSYNHLTEAIKASEDLCHYEYAIANLILGRLEYRMLDFGKSENTGKIAIKHIKKGYEIAADDDTKKSRLLNVADFIRESAEGILWQPNLPLARKYLDEVKSTYDAETARDRFYVRYLYAEMLYNILDGNLDAVFESEETAWEEIGSECDKVRILFYKAFAVLCKGQKKECTEICDTAIAITKKLKIPLESAEIKTLKSIAQDKILPEFKSAIINNWCSHIAKIINETRVKIVNKINDKNKTEIYYDENKN